MDARAGPNHLPAAGPASCPRANSGRLGADRPPVAPRSRAEPPVRRAAPTAATGSPTRSREDAWTILSATMDRVRYEKRLVDLGNRTYAYLQHDGSWGWSNSGLVVGDGRALVVDTLFDLHLTREMLRAYEDVMPPTCRIETVVNSHVNGDHHLGGQLLAPLALVPLRGEPALHRHQRALARVLAADLGLAALEHQPDPVGTALAVDGHPVHGQQHPGHGPALGGVAQLHLLPQPSDPGPAVHPSTSTPIVALYLAIVSHNCVNQSR